MTMQDMGISRVYTTTDGRTFTSRSGAINYMKNKLRYSRMERRNRMIREKIEEQNRILRERLNIIFGNQSGFIDLIIENKADVKRALKGIRTIME